MTEQEKRILERIQALLKEQSKSKRELCEFLNVSPTNFGNWISGRNVSFMRYIHAIATFLGVSVDYLLGKTEIRTSEIKTINDNHGVIGDTHAPVTINNGMVLGEIEREILNVCAKLGIKEKNALLSKAYELLENIT